ncbi:nucleolar protein 3 [Pelodiscus sinensis]|uniref:nucleolar protein 3 n=1 Tax=Pelodiscus sinensis TaxID=13735 RepID=UPI003F6ABF3B
MAAGDNSAVIRTRRKELIGIIQRDPESVLDELLAQSAISEEEYDSMNQMEDTVARIRKLLIYIQRRGEPACRIFLECLESLFPGTNQPWRPSEYDFFNPERDSRPVRNPEPRERDFFNPEHHPKVEEGDGLAPEQESETLRDPEPEEKEDFDPELEEGDGSNPERESDTERDPETGGSDLEQEPETQQDPEPDEEVGSNPEQESETEPDPEPEGSNSEQESDTQ